MGGIFTILINLFHKRKTAAREVRRASGGYTMVVAIVTMLVLSVLTVTLMASAVNLYQRTVKAAHQNTQCELVLEFLEDRLTEELKSADAELTKALFAQIENLSWPNYLTTNRNDPMRERTYTIELSGTEALGDVLDELDFDIVVKMHWETDKTETIYINTDDRELVVDMICRSSEGGYKAIRLRYQRVLEEADFNAGQVWLGAWELLWEEAT